MGSWRDKVVLVTGASGGLGFEIARAFARREAQVCLVARDASRLQLAQQRLEELGGRATTFIADVTKDLEVNKLFQQIIEQFGRLDVLVNNVGRSTRVDIQDVRIADFQELMETNFYTVVRCTQAALPELVKSAGHLVNIGSLASKTAWPFLAPYSASKHAVATYTHQLRIDGPKKVHYMLVCPGPIRRDDAGTRYTEQAAKLPDNAHKPASGARIRGISPVTLAERIVVGCERRRAEIIYPWKAKVLFVLLQISPRWGDWLIRRMLRD
jgi:short-subunit dehydrogenase